MRDFAAANALTPARTLPGANHFALAFVTPPRYSVPPDARPWVVSDVGKAVGKRDDTRGGA